MGSPEFAVPILEQCTKVYSVVGVVTQPDRPAGRGQILTPPPVKETALALGLPIIQPGKLKELGVWEQLVDWAPDLIVVAAFGQILRQNVLDLPHYGCINVHASLLPRWRGAAPIQAAILNGDSVTGVTIMKMDAGVDTGAILAKREIPILDEDTTGLLLPRLANAGAELLIATLPEYLSGSIQPQPQDATLATRAPMIQKDDAQLDLKNPAEMLTRQVRAYQPWPGTYLPWQNGILKVIKAHQISGECEVAARSIQGGLPALGTSKGWLVLDIVQPAGKKAMPGSAFLQGARDWSKN